MLGIRSANIHLRQFRPGDERLFFEVCRYRAEHPAYAGCLTLVSEQLTADEDDDYMADLGTSTRRFIAAYADREIGALTVEAGPMLTADAHELASDVAALGMDYLSELGYGSATVTLNEPTGTRTYTVDPLPEQPEPGPLSIPSGATFVTG